MSVAAPVPAAPVAVAGGAPACAADAGDAPADASAVLLLFADLMGLAPVAAPVAPGEVEEKLPEDRDLDAAAILSQIPIGGPMGITMMPVTPVTPVTPVAVPAAARECAPATPALTAPTAVSGDAKAVATADRLFLERAAPSPGPAPVPPGPDAPLVHLRTVAGLAAAVPFPGDDTSAALAAQGLAAGPAPAPALPAADVQPAPPPVSVPPADPEWPREIAASVAWSVRHKATDVEIKLHPPELGALRVLLKIDGHKVEAQFTAAVPETRQALEQTLPRLREALAGQGLSLMNASVADQQRQAPQDGSFVPPGAADVEPGFTEPVVVRVRARVGRLDEYA